MIRVGAKRLFAGLLGLSAALPNVSAITADEMAQQMGRIANLIGGIFSMQYVADNPWIQGGIIKFLFFILLLGIIQYVAKKFIKLDNKTAGVVAFSIAALATWFTPNAFLGLEIVALIIPLGISIGLTILAFKVFTGSGLYHFLGAGVMWINIWIVENFQTAYENWEFASTQGFATTVLDVWGTIVMLLFVYKLGAAIFTGVGNVGIPDALRDSRQGMRDIWGALTGRDDTPRARSELRPTAPSGLRGNLKPAQVSGTARVDTTHLDIIWNPNHADEGVTQYIVQAKKIGGGRYRPIATVSAPPVNNVDLRTIPKLDWSGDERVHIKVVAVSPRGKGPAAHTIGLQGNDSTEYVKNELDAMERAIVELQGVLADMQSIRTQARPFSLAGHAMPPWLIIRFNDAYARLIQHDNAARTAASAALGNGSFGTNPAEITRLATLDTDHRTVTGDLSLVITDVLHMM